jgi:hypothetical protein
MTTTRTCPCCGTLLPAEEGATRISESWESLRPVVGAPRSIDETETEGPRAPGEPTWWLPSLAYLAYRRTDRADAREALDEFASRREDLHYAVVEEETDRVVGLTLQPWPLLDSRGRLRFPIGEDPLQVDLDADAFAALVHEHHLRWHELGLLDEELIGRPVRIGDAFAMAVSGDPVPDRLRVLESGETDTDRVLYVGGLGARGDPSRLAVPVIDVTWDAREAGKVAHYAAAAGVIGPLRSAATAPMAEEVEERYLAGWVLGVDPRSLPPGTTA